MQDVNALSITQEKHKGRPQGAEEKSCVYSMYLSKIMPDRSLSGNLDSISLNKQKGRIIPFLCS